MNSVDNATQLLGEILAEIRRSAIEFDELAGGNQLLEEILAEIKRGNSLERSGSVSSVKITLQRGTVDVACHAYVGSDIQVAETEALASYRRILTSLNQDGVDAFAKTLTKLGVEPRPL